MTGGGSFGAGGLILVSAAMTYDVISATNSSPQTTEINAAARADTLMKWVKLGLAQAAIFAGVAMVAQAATGEPWWPIAVGALLAGVLLWVQYVHAKNAGMASTAPGTETYGPQPATVYGMVP